MRHIASILVLLVMLNGCISTPPGDLMVTWKVSDGSKLNLNCYKCNIGQQDVVLRISRYWTERADTHVITIFYPRPPDEMPVGAILRSPSNEYLGKHIPFSGDKVTHGTYRFPSGEEPVGTSIWKSGRLVTVQEHNEGIMNEWRDRWNKWFGSEEPPSIFCFSFKLPDPPLSEAGKLVRPWSLWLQYSKDPEIIDNAGHGHWIKLEQEAVFNPLYSM